MSTRRGRTFRIMSIDDWIGGALMKRISAEELLARNPNVDPETLKEAQQLSDRLKESGFEGARYKLATPLTGKRHSDRATDKERGHAHHLSRRH